MNTQENNAATMPPLPPEAVLFQMLFGALTQQSLCIAAKLRIADLLDEKPQTADELAAQTDAHAPSLYRVLRLLASADVFTENADGKFELTPVSALLRADAPNSMRSFAIMQGDDWLWSVFGELMHCVKTGETAHAKVYGAEQFDFLPQNPKDEAIFNDAMTNLSLSAVPPIVEAYDFSGVGKVADIAGGHGFLLAGILKANPQMQGVLFDVPSVVKGAGELLEKENVGDRVKLVSGDFFESVPAGADAYIMKHIIHDWDDARSIKILQNINSAMNENGKVLICEMVVPEGNEPDMSKILDIEMLAITGGKERTEKEYRKLLDAAGFRLTCIVPTRSPYSIVEAVKT